MVVNSKAPSGAKGVLKHAADKTHGLKSTGLKRAAYSQGSVPPPGAHGTTTAPSTLGPSGQKALMFRARKELAPLADPQQAPFD